MVVRIAPTIQIKITFKQIKQFLYFTEGSFGFCKTDMHGANVKVYFSQITVIMLRKRGYFASCFNWLRQSEFSDYGVQKGR